MLHSWTSEISCQVENWLQSLIWSGLTAPADGLLQCPISNCLLFFRGRTKRRRAERPIIGTGKIGTLKKMFFSKKNFFPQKYKLTAKAHTKTTDNRRQITEGVSSLYFDKIRKTDMKMMTTLVYWCNISCQKLIPYFLVLEWQSTIDSLFSSYR